MAQETGRSRLTQPGATGELRRSASGYKALQRITVAIRSQVDLGRVLDLLAADAGRFLDLSLCSIARWDRTGRWLLFSTEYLRDPQPDHRLTLHGKRFEPGSEPEAAALEKVIFQEHLSLISTAASPGTTPGAAFLSQLSPLAHVITPLIAEQRVIGLLVAGRPRELPAWSEEEVEFLRAAGDICAVAIQHAALRAHLRVITATAMEINSPLGLRDLLRRLTEAAMSVTRSAVGMIGVLEGDDLVCRESCRAGVWAPVELRYAPNEGLPGWSRANRAACVSNDIRNDPRAAQQRGPGPDVRSALILPIVNRDGDVLGFFELQNKAAGVPYGEEDVHLASSLAHHAALALEVRRD